LTHREGDPGSAKLMEADKASEMSDLIAHKIKLSRLDDIAQAQGWLTDNNLTIALLKVDVEGHDAQYSLAPRNYYVQDELKTCSWSILALARCRKQKTR
jgi:hypothetical protein